MTRKEMNTVVAGLQLLHGFKVKKGYCCHQESKELLIALGSNYGIYGWNWTLYLDIYNKVVYIDGYRNF